MKSNTLASTDGTSTVGSVLDGNSQRSVPESHNASTSAPIDAATLRSHTSVSNWRTSRPRGAPSAIRKANSRRRLVARASNRFATLAQTMSKTRALAPISKVSGARDRSCRP